MKVILNEMYIKGLVDAFIHNYSQANYNILDKGIEREVTIHAGINKATVKFKWMAENSNESFEFSLIGGDPIHKIESYIDDLANEFIKSIEVVREEIESQPYNHIN